MGPLATFRKLSGVSPNEWVKEPDCSFPQAPDGVGGAQRCRKDPKCPGASAGKEQAAP